MPRPLRRLQDISLTFGVMPAAFRRGSGRRRRRQDLPSWP